MSVPSLCRTTPPTGGDTRHPGEPLRPRIPSLGGPGADATSRTKNPSRAGDVDAGC